MLFGEFCEIFKNTFFIKHLWWLFFSIFSVSCTVRLTFPIFINISILLKINKKQFDHEVFLFYIFLYSCSNRKWSVNIRLQEKYGKIRNRGTFELDQFFPVNMLEMVNNTANISSGKLNDPSIFFGVNTMTIALHLSHKSK